MMMLDLASIEPFSRCQTINHNHMVSSYSPNLPCGCQVWHMLAKFWFEAPPTWVYHGNLSSCENMVPTDMEWVGYLFSKILWYPRSRCEWGIWFQKYYGTHHHAVNGVFVLKNIMVPTVTEWMGYLFWKILWYPRLWSEWGILFWKILWYPWSRSEWDICFQKYYGTHDHKASGILWYPWSQSEWDIMVPTITKWVGYLFSKILWYPRSQSEWDICFKKHYGTHGHGVSGIFVFKNIMVPTVTELVGYLFSKILWCPPSRSEWDKWATNAFLWKKTFLSSKIFNFFSLSGWLGG
jgi:hypothetical protein